MSLWATIAVGGRRPRSSSIVCCRADDDAVLSEGQIGAGISSPGLAEGRSNALDAASRLSVDPIGRLGLADEGDAFVPERQQMLGGQPATVRVVDAAPS